MGRFCCVYGCSNREEKCKNVRFFRVPTVRTHQGKKTYEISKKRRDSWLAKIRRDVVSNGTVKNPLVCSSHFHQGEPVKLYDQTHPDWAPSIAMGHSSCFVSKSSKVTALNRYQRASERSARRLCLEEVDKENNDPEKRPDNCELQEILCVFNLCKSETEGDEVADLTEDNTDKTSSEIPVGELMTWIEFEMGDNKETEKCKCEHVDCLSLERFEENEDKVRFYTGLSGISVLKAVVDLISPGLVQRSSVTKFQLLLMTLMRLRLNFSVQDVGYRFGIHASTVSRVFQSCIQAMYSAMGFLIHWPEREELKLTMPMCFREKFSSCTVIIDCFEIFIDRPSCLLARAQTWSSYKHHNTAKFLIGITPQGTVSYISKGWGGRASDKFITDHCGLLKKLVPEDLVLADRGFDIEESCGLYCARLQIPSFTRGKAQLSPFEIESTRSIANVRIHVERVIGSVRQKYSILGHGIIPIDYLQSTIGTPCLLDKIAFVCCALANCCKSVVSVD